MLKPLVWGLILVLSTPSLVMAQAARPRTLPRPFVKHTVSKQELIEACRTDKVDVMHVTCDQMRLAVNAAFKGMTPPVDLEFVDTAEFLEYLDNLAVESCPQDGKEHGLARIMPNAAVDLTGHRRKFNPGENCLQDNNLGVWVLSLSCGNPITERIDWFPAGREEVGEETRKSIDDMARKAVAEALAKESSTKTHHDKGHRSHKGLIIGGTTVLVVGGVLCAIFCRSVAESSSCSSSTSNGTSTSCK